LQKGLVAMKAAASRRSALRFRAKSYPQHLSAARTTLASLAANTSDAVALRQPPLPVVVDSGQFAVGRGSAGDHPSVLQFLLSIFHRPSATEFQAQLDAPAYTPRDRLLVRRAGSIVAHAALVRRQVRFGSLSLDTCSLRDFAVLPEYREQGCGSALLAAAEQRLREDGLAFATLCTRRPQFFLKRGWCIGARHSYSLAHASDILSHLRETEAPRCHALHPAERPLNVRLWRHVELAALKRLHVSNSCERYGPLVRNDDYWRWLIDRRGYDRIYVAIDGPDKLDLGEEWAPIVGYAVMRQERILEIMTERDHPRAAGALLGRACGDAMERDTHLVRIDAPADDPLHQRLVTAGGCHYVHEADSGEVFLVKILDPVAFLRQTASLFLDRARAARVSLPCELGLKLDQERYGLSLLPAELQIQEGKLGRSYLACSRADFTQLAFGHLDLTAAQQSGRLMASTRVAQDLAAALFLRRPLWHPPWDDQQAH